jgi:uncharacterized protein YuzE
MMTLEVDNKGQAAYLRVRTAQIARTARVTDDLLLDYDASGCVVGVELLNVRVVDVGKEAIDAARQTVWAQWSRR